MTIQQIIEAAEAEAKGFLNFITPIYRPHSKREHPDQIATAIYLSVTENYFIGTAAHVLDHNAESTLYCAGDTTIEPIEGPSVRSALVEGRREDDKMDMGIVKLSSDAATRIGLHHFLPITAANLNDHGEAEFYIAVGYPAARNTKIVFENRSVRRKPLSFTNRLHPIDAVKNLGLNPACHLLLNFDKRKVFTTDNQEKVAPNPTGMSGGPLLRLNVGTETASSALAGMLIEWEQKTNVKGMLAVRIAVVSEAIRFMCPELDAVVPKVSDLQVAITQRN